MQWRVLVETREADYRKLSVMQSWRGRMKHTFGKLDDRRVVRNLGDTLNSESRTRRGVGLDVEVRGFDLRRDNLRHNHISPGHLTRKLKWIHGSLKVEAVAAVELRLSLERNVQLAVERGRARAALLYVVNVPLESNVHES
jgi:hypothetical protein